MMKFVRDSKGISEKRKKIYGCDSGIKTFSIENFSCGEQKDGQHIENAVGENGRIYSLAPPVTFGKNAKKPYIPENLLYAIGPSSETGGDVFNCSGSAEKTNTYSDGHIVKTTLTFDSTSELGGEDTDYAFFSVTLQAGTYYFHFDIGGSASGKVAGIKFMDTDETVIWNSEATAVSDGEKYFINAAFTASSDGTYNIGIAPVYGDCNTYSIDICRLYLFNKTSAEESGCTPDILSVLDFSGRYGTVLLPYTINTDGELASYIGETGFYFSVGTDVYRRTDNGNIYLMKSDLCGTEKRRFALCGETLYLYTESGIFSVSESNCTAVIPYVPKYAKNCSYTGASFTKNEKINIFSEYADIVFTATDNLTRTTPSGLYIDSVVSVKSGVITLSENQYTVSVSGGTATVTLANISLFEVTLRVKLGATAGAGRISYGSCENLRKAFCSVKTLCEAKTSSAAKTVLAADGNKIYPLDIQSGVYIGACDTYLETDGDVTAILPYLQWFLVFTEGSVKKLTVGGGENTTLSLVSVKNDFGCDMPESAISDGDSVVFANSEHGIYFINRYGISGSDVSRRISANIDSLFSGYTKTEKSSAAGIFFDGKYYLIIGGDALIWDFQKKIPAYSQNSENEEKKLIWSVYKAMGACKIIGEENSLLYLFGADGIKYFAFDISASSGGGTEYISETLYPAGQYASNVISEIFISGRFADTATVEIICDGITAPDKYTLAAADIDTLYRIRLPLRKFRGISVKICGGAMILMGIKIRYYTTE